MKLKKKSLRKQPVQNFQINHLTTIPIGLFECANVFFHFVRKFYLIKKKIPINWKIVLQLSQYFTITNIQT